VNNETRTILAIACIALLLSSLAIYITSNHECEYKKYPQVQQQEQINTLIEEQGNISRLQNQIIRGVNNNHRLIQETGK